MAGINPQADGTYGEHPHKAEALQAFKDGMNAPEICKRFGVHRTSLAKWLKDALKPKEEKPNEETPSEKAPPAETHEESDSSDKPADDKKDVVENGKSRTTQTRRDGHRKEAEGGDTTSGRKNLKPGQQTDMLGISSRVGPVSFVVADRKIDLDLESLYEAHGYFNLVKRIDPDIEENFSEFIASSCHYVYKRMARREVALAGANIRGGDNGEAGEPSEGDGRDGEDSEQVN